MEREDLKKVLGKRCTDRQFASILANPFMNNIEEYSFDEWKKTFAGAFLLKNTQRPQIIRMMGEALQKDLITWEDLSKINLVRIASYIKDKVSPNSACTYLNIIKAFLNEYSEENVIPCKNIMGVLSGKKVPSQHIALTENELEKLNDYLPKTETEKDVKNLFMKCVLTGCRSSDAKRMTLDNITNGFLSYVSQKTKTEVTLPVHKWLHKYINERCKTHTTAVANRTIQRICRNIGINEDCQLYVKGRLQKGEKWEFVTLHTARRTFCTILAGKDVPVEIIKTLAGHSTTNMTDRYICLDGKRPGSNAMTFFNN